MSWYTHKFWRFALSPSTEGLMLDGDGIWAHAVCGVWLLVVRGGA